MPNITPRPPSPLRILGVKLTDRAAAACAVWQVMSNEELVYDLTGRVPLRTFSAPPDQIPFDGATAVTCWLFPREDAADWRCKGFGDCDYDEYVQRVENLRRQCEESQLPLYVIECPLPFMEATLRRLNLTTRDVAIALQHLFMESPSWR